MVNMEEMLWLENHYFATIIVKIRSGKNHDKWVLNLGGNVDDKQSIFMILKCLFISCKGEKNSAY